MDLLVSYPRGCYGPAKNEIARILGRFGDREPHVEKVGVPGICVVHTRLDGRQVVGRCAELFRGAPDAFRFAISWVLVDYWCDKDLEAIKRLIEQQVATCIGAQETWAMKVEKRGWPQYHTTEIIQRLGEMSVLRPGELFSSHAPALELAA